jgi:hypothetical protein
LFSEACCEVVALDDLQLASRPMNTTKTRTTTTIKRRARRR